MTCTYSSQRNSAPACRSQAKASTLLRFLRFKKVWTRPWCFNNLFALTPTAMVRYSTHSTVRMLMNVGVRVDNGAQTFSLPKSSGHKSQRVRREATKIYANKGSQHTQRL
jgi:hypothetical protein